jgi:hypothetical protein
VSQKKNKKQLTERRFTMSKLQVFQNPTGYVGSSPQTAEDAESEPMLPGHIQPNKETPGYPDKNILQAIDSPSSPMLPGHVREDLPRAQDAIERKYSDDTSSPVLPTPDPFFNDLPFNDKKENTDE